MNKELITGTDYDFYADSRPIRYASNNSNGVSWGYRLSHNCEWQVVYEEDKNIESLGFNIDFWCIAKRSIGIPDDCNDIIFYNNACSKNQGIILGSAIGEDCFPGEVFFINFDKIDSDVNQIDFLITRYEGDQPKKHDIGLFRIKKLRVRMVGDKVDLLRHNGRYSSTFQYDYSKFPYENVVVKIGSLIRDELEWLYKPVVEGFNANLRDVIRTYGFNI